MLRSVQYRTVVRQIERYFLFAKNVDGNCCAAQLARLVCWQIHYYLKFDFNVVPSIQSTWWNFIKLSLFIVSSVFFLCWLLVVLLESEWCRWLWATFHAFWMLSTAKIADRREIRLLIDGKSNRNMCTMAQPQRHISFDVWIWTILSVVITVRLLMLPFLFQNIITIMWNVQFLLLWLHSFTVHSNIRQSVDWNMCDKIVFRISSTCWKNGWIGTWNRSAGVSCST